MLNIIFLIVLVALIVNYGLTAAVITIVLFNIALVSLALIAKALE